MEAHTYISWELQSKGRTLSFPFKPHTGGQKRPPCNLQQAPSIQPLSNLVILQQELQKQQQHLSVLPTVSSSYALSQHQSPAPVLPPHWVPLMWLYGTFVACTFSSTFLPLVLELIGLDSLYPASDKQNQNELLKIIIRSEYITPDKRNYVNVSVHCA